MINGRSKMRAPRTGNRAVSFVLGLETRLG